MTSPLDVRSARLHLPVGVVHGRQLAEPEAVHVVLHPLAAELDADLRPHRVDRVRQRLGERDVAVVLAAEVVQRLAGDRLAVLAADLRVRLIAAGVDRGRGRDRLERRAGRIQALRRVVEDRGPFLARVLRVKRRGPVQHPHRGGLDVERDDGALAALERVLRDLLRLRVERRLQIVADDLLVDERVHEPAQLLLAADERVVVLLLEPGPPEDHVVEADGLREQPPGRVAARVAPVGERDAAGEHLAVGGADDAALDPLLLEHHAAVVLVLAQPGGAEHGPARTEPDQHREEHDEEREETEDRRVHDTGCLARLEISSSRASSTKLATIEDPP